MKRARLHQAAVVLALFLFGAATPPYLLAHSLLATLFDAGSYHQLIDKLGAGDRLRPAVMRLALYQMFASGGRLPPAVASLSAEQWEAMSEALIPADWLAGELHRAVDAGLDWMGGNEPLPAITLELGTIQDRLRGSSGDLALLALFENTPACQPNEILAPNDAPLGSYAVYLPCIPVGANLSVLSRATGEYAAGQLPAETDLPGLISVGAVTRQAMQGLDRLRFWLQWSEAAVGLASRVCLLTFVLYLLLTVRRGRDLAEMSIAPLALAAGYGLLLAAVLWGVSIWVTRPGQAWIDEALWPGTGSLAREAAAYLIRAATVRLALWSAGLMLAAALGWGLEKLVKRGETSSRELLV